MYKFEAVHKQSFCFRCLKDSHLEAVVLPKSWVFFLFFFKLTYYRKQDSKSGLAKLMWTKSCGFIVDKWLH